MYQQMGYVAALLTLAALSSEDIKKREISLVMLLLSGGAAVLYSLLGNPLSFPELFEKCLPGIGLLMLAFFTNGQMGCGDGATIIVLGLWTCAKFALWTVYIGILLAGVVGIYILISGKNQKELPLIPFLLISMEVLLWNA